MVADPSHYVGREQALVKHSFLESYLQSLIFKTASSYAEIAYVDGFSGPWQSKDEKFEDTSFGIALKALREAKAAWKRLRGIDVRMSAYLVEQNAKAFANLTSLQERYPDITIHPANRNFVDYAPELLRLIPAQAFAFQFIDPKGWRIPMQQLAPLLSRPNSEVVFNFMFDFINRAASISDQAIISALAELMPHGDWRARLSAIPAGTPDTSRLRKQVLIDSFRETLGAIGGYAYVAELPVLMPLKDRTLYSLIYGTRHSTGIEVFRASQIKALQEQEVVRSATRHAHVQAKSGQGEMYGPEVRMRESEVERFLRSEESLAESALLDLTPELPSHTTYEKVWPEVLARHAVTKPGINKLAAELRKTGQLIFPDWAPRDRVPKGHYRMSRSEWTDGAARGGGAGFR